MKQLCIAAVLALLVGCGDDEPKKSAVKPAPPPPPVQATPKPPPPPTPPPTPEPPRKYTGEVGKSTVGALWVCPETGCKYYEAKKNTCLTHPTTTLREQWFVCSKCSVSEPVAGKCSKCGGELAKVLKP